MNTSWSEKVRALELIGWSLTGLAEAVGLSVQALSDVKQGRTRAPAGMAAVQLHHLYSTGAKPPTPEVPRPELLAGEAKCPVRRAAALVGSQSELARRISAVPGQKPITPQGVGAWCRGEVLIPPERVLAIEAITGGQVTRHELRPDIYPREQAA